MKRRLISAFLLLVASLPMVATAAEPVKPPAREKFHLYLLVGQSNMAGRGRVQDQDKVPHPRVVMFTKDQVWAPAIDPLHFDKSSAGVGLGSTFGRVLADADPTVTIGLIPCAVGGSSLKEWERGRNYHRISLKRAKAALQNGTLKGIIWHQGESDSGRQETAESYAERLAKLVVDFRMDLDAADVPFVAGELGHFLAKERDGNPSFWPIVNQQINSLPKLVPKTAVVSSAELKDKGDGVHFDSVSLREFGKRYAAAMQKLQAAP